MQNTFQLCLLVITYSQHINIFFTLQITIFTKCLSRNAVACANTFLKRAMQLQQKKMLRY